MNLYETELHLYENIYDLNYVCSLKGEFIFVVIAESNISSEFKLYCVPSTDELH